MNLLRLYSTLTIRFQLGLLLAVLLAVLLVFGWISFPYLSSSKGSTYGLIYIDTPEVYTRERLVNDRFQQDAWLRLQLNRDVKFGVQASTSNSKSSDTTGVVNKDAKTEADWASAPQSPPELSPVSATPIEQFRDELSYREEIRNELLENQLDDRHDIAGNTLYRLKFDASVVPEYDTSAYAMVEVTIEGKDKHPLERKESDIFEVFKFGKDSKNTRYEAMKKRYRMWIEEGPKTYLDPLIRLSEMESDRLDRFHLVYLNWIELLAIDLKEQARSRLWSADTKDANVQICSKQDGLRNIVDIGGGCVGSDDWKNLEKLRRKFVELLRGDLSCSRNWVESKTELEESILALNYESIYSIISEIGAQDTLADNCNQIVSAIRELLDTVPPVFINPTLKRFFAPKFEYKGDWNKLDEHLKLRRKVVHMLLGEVKCAPNWAKSHGALEESVLDLNFSDISSIISEIATSETPAGMCDQLASTIGELLDTAYPDDPEYQESIEGSIQEFDKSIQKDEGLQYDFDLVYRSANDRALFTKFQESATELGLLDPDRPLTSLVKVLVDEESGEMVIETGLANFIIKLIESKGQIYTYAVTPKERVQRISRDTRMMQSMGLAAGAQQQGIEGSFTHRAERTAQVNQISRQPLLVGYSPSTAAGSSSTSMGWLIGPRFKIPASASASVSFRHVPSQHTLTGIISVPSWWKELTMSTTTYWLDESGEEHDRTEQINIEVSLPGDLQSVTETLLPHLDAQNPIIDQDSVTNVVLNACEKGAIVIRGAHLWRSTVVTLGSQEADAITVLPSMNGIIAKFYSVNPPPEPVNIEPKDLKDQEDQRRTLELVVWTSEGEDAADDKITIEGPKSCPSE